jgi:hypothetical protein
MGFPSALLATEHNFALIYDCDQNAKPYYMQDHVIFPALRINAENSSNTAPIWSRRKDTTTNSLSEKSLVASSLSAAIADIVQVARLLSRKRDGPH